MSPPDQAAMPLSTMNFLDTLGVDTHMAYTDGKYANFSQVISDLKYLGIDQVRDGITNGVDADGNPNGSAPLSTYIAMAQAGIKFTVIIEPTSEAVIQTQLALINQVVTAVPGSVIAIEGPNEINNAPITFNGLTGQQAAIAAQQALYAAAHADPVLTNVPVDYFTGYTVGSTDPTTTPGLADFDNQHPYPNFGEAPAFWVSRAQALTNLSAADVATAPAVYTETGYSTGAVPADVQENYTLDLLMDTAKDGISQTYLYDLLDAYAPGSPQGDDGFGLFDYTGAPKPIATAIHNLTALLQDTATNAASFKPASLSYAITGLPPTGNSLLLEKSNGTYVLVVWAEPEIFDSTTDQEVAAPAENVHVTLPKSFASIQVFDPTAGTAALASYTNSNSLTVSVTDHPIFIELGATPVTSAPPVLTIATPVQVANTSEVTFSGTVTDATATTVQIKDGSTVLGNATVSNGSWSYTSANLAAGSQTFSAVATDLAGNTSTASDAAFSVAAPALTIVYTSGVDTSTTTRTVSSTTPVTIASAGSDGISLAIAEDAYLGDAEFTVSVDGKQIGGVQTATALHSAGLSQNFTLQGNFGAGSHVVSVDFLNDAVAVYSNGAVAGDRNLYVESITGDGVTAGENVEQYVSGTTNYTIKLPATVVTTTPLAPVVTLAAASSAASSSTATLGTAVAGNSGDTLTVKLVSDADFVTGSALVLTNGSLIYTPGTITAANAGTDTISYTVTDSTNGLTTTETQKVTLVGPVVVKPTVTIASQVLGQDTGASATDDITSNGAVTLTGTVTGATGTVVTILDGTTLLGSATISSGKWTFGVTLSAGTHTLHAVATDPSGNSVASAAEPAITVDTVAPALTIAAPVQIAGTTEVTFSGTVTDATATTVQIKDGSTVLGNATVSNGSWSYTSANLAAGSQTFSAVATDLAGNTSTVVVDGVTVTPPASTAPPDELLATVSTGTGTTQLEVNLSSSTLLTGTYVPVSSSGIGTNPLVLYNWSPATQLQGFLAAQAAGTASIVGIGDSWTSGFGASTDGWTQLSYLNEMSQALTQDGVAAQTSNFLGSEFYISNGIVDDNRLTPVGYPTTSTFYDGGFTIVAGGNSINLAGAGKGFNFQLDTPGNYNEVTLSYIDIGSGSVNLKVDGASVGSMNFGNTGETLTQTIKIPAGSHSDLVVTSNSANPVYIQGASFYSTTNPAIQVYNAGIGGWDSTNADASVYMGQLLRGSSNGYGETASAAALRPSLAFIDLGSNDIAEGEDTTAQSLASIEQIVGTLRAAGTDVVIMIPQPFGSPEYATALPALRAGLEAYSLANNVPIIDLSATYGDSESALEAAGLKSDLLHGDATLYADIGSQLATLLTTTIKNAVATGTDANIVSEKTNGTMVAKAENASIAVSALNTASLPAAGDTTVSQNKTAVTRLVTGTNPDKLAANAISGMQALQMKFLAPGASPPSLTINELSKISKAELFATTLDSVAPGYQRNAVSAAATMREYSSTHSLEGGLACISHQESHIQYSAPHAHIPQVYSTV